MADETYKRKLTAILSADVVGYSRLMGEDEAATVSTLKSHRDLIFIKIEAYKGRVIDSPGDNLLAEFRSIVDAVSCAVAIQEGIESENKKLPENRQMLFRIGVNLGDVIQDGNRIYGDGVNIAARVESLAEPGGIAISRTVFSHIQDKLKYGYEYLGEQEVKNIARPVEVYKLLTSQEDVGKVIGAPKPPPFKRPYTAGIAALLIIATVAIWFFYPLSTSRDSSSIEKADLMEPVKASIAVLPFDNMSNDPDQAYFGSGISENLITDLSKVPNLLVIARNSSFAYRGKSVKIEEIAKELNVGYVLEGSVQKAGNQLRINAQLIDAATGNHLWADRYDGSLEDIFSLQDRITQKITASLAVRLSDDAKKRLIREGTQNVEAYEAYLKGVDTAHYLRMDPVRMAESMPYLEKAIALDPDYSNAHAALAEVYMRGSIFGIHRKLGISMKLVRMRAAAYLRTAMQNPTHVV